MDNILVQDSISDLPQSIVETILTKTPIRDAVRTSILSSKWRYKWANLTHLVFDDRCASPYDGTGLVEGHIVKFITQFLLLHDGPIHMFTLSSTYLQGSPYIDQWLLFLTRKDVKELVIELGDREWFRAPSCLFSCQKLTRLELIRCELNPPPTFEGYLSLKCLVLQQVLIAPDKVENLLSSCPLLESLTLSYLDSFTLSIRAPNLKYLCLEGEFENICLENTPLLIFMSVSMYMSDNTAEHFEQSSSCNFDKFFGGVPCLQRVIGYIYFTKGSLFAYLWPKGLLMLLFCPKYLSVGNELGELSITFNHLKIVELYQVSFEDMKEILVILRLILNSPILQELQISSSSNTSLATEAPDLDFWENECPSDCTFRQLKTVKIADISGVPHEMEFIKFLLRSSPVLEIMSIIPSACVTDGRVNMLNEELQEYRERRRKDNSFCLSIVTHDINTGALTY